MGIFKKKQLAHTHNWFSERFNFSYTFPLTRVFNDVLHGRCFSMLTTRVHRSFHFLFHSAMKMVFKDIFDVDIEIISLYSRLMVSFFI